MGPGSLTRVGSSFRVPSIGARTSGPADPRALAQADRRLLFAGANAKPPISWLTTTFFFPSSRGPKSDAPSSWKNGPLFSEAQAVPNGRECLM